jgi:hypothetical protein
MAYGRTFLQLVNDVLREMRETEVTTWNESEYSTLVGSFINSCKRDSENAWQWTDLRNTFTVTTAVDTITYELEETDQRAQILDGYNYTTGGKLGLRTWQYMNQVYFGVGSASPLTGSCDSFVPNGVSASTGAAQIDIYPSPSAIESLRFTVYQPQLDLDSNSDVMIVPFRPVVEGAIARARFERGEDGGISFEGQAAFMARAMGDHIAIEANRTPEDLMWEPV